MKDKISDKDKKDWDEFIKNDEKLPVKDIFFQKTKLHKILSLDLHGYSLDEANKKVKDFIISSYNKKINKLIIVTGKGLHSQHQKNPYISSTLSILRYSIPEFIKKNKELMNLINRFDEANIEDGGQGAFYIYLKSKRD